MSSHNGGAAAVGAVVDIDNETYYRVDGSLNIEALARARGHVVHTQRAATTLNMPLVRGATCRMTAFIDAYVVDRHTVWTLIGSDSRGVNVLLESTEQRDNNK